MSAPCRRRPLAPSASPNAPALPALVALVALFALFARPAAAQAPKHDPKSPARKPAPEIVAGDVGRALDEALLAFDPAAGGYCGVALVASKGKVLLQKGYGVADAEKKLPMAPDALYDWASVTKQFTAAAWLRLIEASRLDDAALKRLGVKRLAEALRGKRWKKLALDDPLSRFFPDAPKEKAGVTLRQILNHTSGIESGFKKEWKFDASNRDSFVKLVLSLPMAAKPGEKWEYSNSGYAFAAALLEIVSGMTYEEFCRELLFRPAGMTSASNIGQDDLDLARVPRIERGAGFSDRPKEFAFAYGNRLSWGYRGCGGVVASTLDMLAWDRALRDPKFLSKESQEELYRVGRHDYALGWNVKRTGSRTRVEHSGGVFGVVTWYLRDLEDDDVVALAMSYAPKSDPGALAARLASIAQRGR